MNRQTFLLSTFLLSIALICTGFTTPQTLQEQRLFKKACKTARGNHDFGFMYFKRLITPKTHAQFRAPSLFAVGEYYFKEKLYHDAKRCFETYVEEFPTAEGAVFAYGYMLKLLDQQAADGLSKKEQERIVRDIYAQPIVFLFSQSRDLLFTSAFDNRYEAHYYVDKVIITLNDEIFLEITL